MEMDLTKLEDLSASIVQDFEYMRKREEEMRDTNGNRFRNGRQIVLFSSTILFFSDISFLQSQQIQEFFI